MDRKMEYLILEIEKAGKGILYLSKKLYKGYLSPFPTPNLVLVRGSFKCQARECIYIDLMKTNVKIDERQIIIQERDENLKFYIKNPERSAYLKNIIQYILFIKNTENLQSKIKYIRNFNSEKLLYFNFKSYDIYNQQYLYILTEDISRRVVSYKELDYKNRKIVYSDDKIEVVLDKKITSKYYVKYLDLYFNTYEKNRKIEKLKKFHIWNYFWDFKTLYEEIKQYITKNGRENIIKYVNSLVQKNIQPASRMTSNIIWHTSREISIFLNLYLGCIFQTNNKCWEIVPKNFLTKYIKNKRSCIGNIKDAMHLENSTFGVKKQDIIIYSILDIHFKNSYLDEIVWIDKIFYNSLITSEIIEICDYFIENQETNIFYKNIFLIIKILFTENILNRYLNFKNHFTKMNKELPSTIFKAVLAFLIEKFDKITGKFKKNVKIQITCNTDIYILLGLYGLKYNIPKMRNEKTKKYFIQLIIHRGDYKMFNKVYFKYFSFNPEILFTKYRHEFKNMEKKRNLSLNSYIEYFMRIENLLYDILLDFNLQNKRIFLKLLKIHCEIRLYSKKRRSNFYNSSKNQNSKDLENNILMNHIMPEPINEQIQTKMTAIKLFNKRKMNVLILSRSMSIFKNYELSQKYSKIFNNLMNFMDDFIKLNTIN
ncbi:hypothetical protein CWI39_0047p0030 [Hamiltosporidium magnivora]|uniref:Uncharacterized protein n=1 Tax=Hamiltosporidium magnivora TaxID=148818 RepID=A0A4V2JWY6_9MICR|nr:hypothetical protein CWI39_0047p0030 [Hamiltosporidium magnivora]